MRISPASIIRKLVADWATAIEVPVIARAVILPHHFFGADPFLEKLVRELILNCGDWKAAVQALRLDPKLSWPDLARLELFRKWAEEFTAPAPRRVRGLLTNGGAS